jgi:hypothetical protein
MKTEIECLRLAYEYEVDANARLEREKRALFDALAEIATARQFDNIVGWARNRAKEAIRAELGHD